jgi:hypothetical protein
MKKLSEITDWHQLINEVVCGKAQTTELILTHEN